MHTGSKGGLGSSKSYPPTMNLGGGYFSTDPTQNPLMYNWNKVHMNYCDGASFSGNNDTVQVYQNVSLHWRGSRIRENIVRENSHSFFIKNKTIFFPPMMLKRAGCVLCVRAYVCVCVRACVRAGMAVVLLW